MISIRLHNAIDYILGAAFLLSPYIFGFSRTFFAHDVFTALGIGMIGYSLLSDYRWSLARAIPLGMHRGFDVLSGTFTILAPWIYGYRDLLTPTQTAVHWTLGLMTISIALLTVRTRPIEAVVVPPEEVAPPAHTETRARPKRAA